MKDKVAAWAREFYELAFAALFDCFELLKRGLLTNAILVVQKTNSHQLTLHWITEDGTQNMKATISEINEILSGGAIAIPKKLTMKEYIGILQKNRRRGELLFKVTSLSMSRTVRYHLISAFDSKKWVELSSITRHDSIIGREPLNFAEFLYFIVDNRCIYDLIKPDSNATLLTSRELLEHASDWFLSGWLKAIPGLKADSLHKTFDDISTLGYEKRTALGRLLLAPKSLVSIEMEIRDGVRLDDLRAVRKLLEISSSRSYLLADGQTIYGLGHPRSDYDVNSDSIIALLFEGRHRWSVNKIGNNQEPIALYEVINGYARIKPPQFDKDDFQSKLKALFPSITRRQMNNLCRVVEGVTLSKHGTIIVIDAHADSEADRLRQQATRITPVQLAPLLMNEVASIDGAILVDLSGTCHAFGVILDGHARSNLGESSRGSRFNSALRYIDSRSGLALAVIVSEDGYIDVISGSPPS